MISKVCGFLTVRLPYMNYDPAGRGTYLQFPPCINEICYGGIDRMEWFDIDEEFHKRNLSSAMEQKRQFILDQNDDFSGINVCHDLDTAIELLPYFCMFSCKNNAFLFITDYILHEN